MKKVLLRTDLRRALREDRSDTIVDVWVVPGANRSEIVGVHNDALRVRVAAPPEHGEANRALLDELFEIVNKNNTPPHAVQGHLDAIEAFEACDDLGKITAPTLVITGADDRLIPAENSTQMADAIPGAKANLLPDAAHFFWIEKPEATARALIDFFTHLG